MKFKYRNKRMNKVLYIVGMCLIFSIMITLKYTNHVFADDGGDGDDVTVAAGYDTHNPSNPNQPSDGPNNKNRTLLVYHYPKVTITPASQVCSKISSKYSSEKRAYAPNTYYYMGGTSGTNISRLYDSSSPQRATKTVEKIIFQNQYGGETKETRVTLDPALYTVITGVSYINYNKDYKILYYLWHLDGPMALYHKDMGTGGYTDNSRNWKGVRVEMVHVPNDKQAIGSYVATGKPYESYNTYKQGTYFWTYYKDYSPYDPIGKDRLSVLARGSWTTQAQKISSGYCYGPVITNPFTVLLQDLNTTKEETQVETITNADVTTELVK